ncbi:hypothetical protein BDZ91DRAFT_711789 [Kalaharituber pfeilii]|nr:hypothetical protein BDZ91DRAFT_711789 [Kalaharituber pfeilii]
MPFSGSNHHYHHHHGHHHGHHHHHTYPLRPVYGPGATTYRKPSLISRLLGATPGHASRNYPSSVYSYGTTSTAPTYAPSTYSTHSHRTWAAPYGSSSMRPAGMTTVPSRRARRRRRPSLTDKISGAILKLRGTLMRNPGEKAAGTRRMRGTDGRGTRRSTRYHHTATRRRLY